MLNQKYIVKNPNALGSREVAALVGSAKNFKSKISLRYDDNVIDARSLISVMNLTLAEGKELEVNTFGEDEGNAMKAITDILKNIKLV
jgi:phosphotransferase system HPr (HPr) family protein